MESRIVLMCVFAIIAGCGGGGGGGGGAAATAGATAKLALFAGNLGGPGSADGPTATARFYWPMGVATDSAGNIYVADNVNFAIRKITPDGVVSTFAGMAGVPGSSDGTGSDARFSHPTGVATDSAGNLYVSDDITIRKITPAGVVSTVAGTAGVKAGLTARKASRPTVHVISTWPTLANCNILKITAAGVRQHICRYGWDVRLGRRDGRCSEISKSVWRGHRQRRQYLCGGYFQLHHP